MRPLHWKPTMVLAACALVAMAGCLDLDGEDLPNRAPEAHLAASAEEAWAGQDVTFDARNSTDPDGNITGWRFDFGDGTVVNLSDDEEPVVNHTFEMGGVYLVTLTVTDDGAENVGAATDTATLTMPVHENLTIGTQVVYSGAAQNATASGKYSRIIDVAPDGDRFIVNLTMESVLIVGSTELQVRFLDPARRVLAEETVTLDATGARGVVLEGALASQGEHRLEVVAESGGATFDGWIHVLYAA